MILEAHVGWSPLLGWCLRRFQRPVAVVSVVASGVMVIALLVLCLSVAPARADITPGYDPYTHTGGSHSGRTGDKECTPREDFINTVFWYRGSGSRNMQRWLSSVLGYTNVYNGPLAPKFHVHFDNRSNWDWSMHGLPSWYRYTWRSAQNSMGTDYLGVPARDHIRLFAGPYKDRHRYLDWSVGSAHYDVAVWDMYGSTWYPWHLVLSYEDSEYRVWKAFARAGYSVGTRYLGNAGFKKVYLGGQMLRIANSGVAHTIRIPYRK